MSILQVATNLIVDNMSYLGVLLIIWILVDILGYAFLGRRK